MRLRFSPFAAPLLALALFATAPAPLARAAELTEIPFRPIGQILPRAAKDIAASDWSIGCEVLDRDFAKYDAYKSYLGPLGAKGVRLQAGWAKTEKVPGTYDWAWLDRIIDDAVAQGTQPWVQLSYGNPAYPGGGGKNIGEAGPTSPEALAAWDRWARALVHRYRDKVFEWEIWNEPDNSKTMTLDDYLGLFVRSAEIIRAEQPKGRIDGYAGGHEAAYAGRFLDRLVTLGKLDLIDALTFHAYSHNPDSLGPLAELRTIVAKYPRSIPLREGETGAPSQKTTGALRNYDWNEPKQAKWVVRRMLAYHGNGVPFSLFTLSDFMYPNGLNAKGLLEINPDFSVKRPKPSYLAAQTVCAIFDLTWAVDPRFSVSGSAPAKLKLAAYGYRHTASGHSLVTLWQSQEAPEEPNRYQPIDLALRGASFTDPVYVDLRTGIVYELPKDRWLAGKDGVQLHDFPVYDSAVLIADRSDLRFGVLTGSHP